MFFARKHFEDYSIWLQKR